MEARASFSGASVPKAFVAAILVLVALGLAAMGGYAARSLTGSGAVTAVPQVGHAAPGTVLRQDNPARAKSELPGYILQYVTPKPASRILQDDPYFISQYAAGTPQNSAKPSRGYRELE